MARIEKKRSFKYQERSREDVKARANQRGGGFDSFIKQEYKLYKVRDGKNLIRILPPTWEGARHYGYDVFVNYNIGVDNQSYLSLAKMKNERDPLAEARREAEKEGDEEAAKALRPTQRILMWVIDRMDEDEGPMLWSAPITVDKAIANISIDEDTKEVVQIDEPNEGCDLRFHREGQGLKTKYDASKMRLMKPSPLHEDEKLQEEWLEYIQENPLPDVLNYYDYEHIAGVFNGGGSSKKDDDEDEDEAPKRTRRKVADDDEDEDEKPASKSKRKAAADDDDDQDDLPFDTDDEDEDEKPTRRQRARLNDDDEDEKPAKKATKKQAADDDEGDDEDTGKSVRDRLRNRRGVVKSDDDED